MGYVLSVKGFEEFAADYVINNAVQPVSLRFPFLRNAHFSYSYRTGRNDGPGLVLGECSIPHSANGIGGIVDYLEAEQTAIRELNAEAGSEPVLGTGTWGLKDAGHVFSTVSQPGGHGLYLYGWHSSGVKKGYSFSPISMNVDPFTAQLLGGQSFVHKSGRRYSCPIVSVGNRTDLMDDLQDMLWSMHPGKVRGALGQDLVDLVELPKLIKHLISFRSDMGDLYRKWQRLPQDVRNLIDAGFKNRRKFLAKASSSSADKFLQWEFVLSPYISDIQLLLSTAFQVTGQVTHAIKRSRHSNPYRYPATRPLMGYSPYQSSDGSFGASFGSAIWPSQITWSGICNYDAIVKTKWRLYRPSSDSFSSYADSLNQKLGFIYPSLWWDLSPWTFVLDWFIHIGNSIDRASYLTDGKYSMDYAWATIKGSSGVFINTIRPFYTDPEWIHCSELSAFTQFQTRIPLDPKRGLKPKFSSLTSFEKLLLGALGLTHLK